MPVPAELPEPVLPQGLSWSWEMDFATVLAALGDGPPAGANGGPAAGALDPVMVMALMRRWHRG